MDALHRHRRGIRLGGAVASWPVRGHLAHGKGREFRARLGRMKIYTRTGDKGETGLFGGARVAKDDVRVEAYGTVDETNAAIGLAGAHCSVPFVRSVLEQLQADLFTLGAE